MEVIAIGTESEGPAIGTAADALAETFRLYWVDANCWYFWQRRWCFDVTDYGTNAQCQNSLIKVYNVIYHVNCAQVSTTHRIPFSSSSQLGRYWILLVAAFLSQY